MKQNFVLTFLSFVLLLEASLSQTGFPKQFVAILNQTSLQAWQNSGVQQFVYDSILQRIRFDLKGWREKQNETYMIQYKPSGAEHGSPAADGYTLFNFNPDYPENTKGHCWYNTQPMKDLGPIPFSWMTAGGDIDIKPWFPLPSNLIYKGVEHITELDIDASRYDSSEMCDLQQSDIGKVPCLSYFETNDEIPVKTITAKAARPHSYETDEYATRSRESVYESPRASVGHSSMLAVPFLIFERLSQRTSTWLRRYTESCGDNFTLQLLTPPVHSLGDEVTITFSPKPNWYYNGTECARFTVNGNEKIVFTYENWNEPQQVDLTFRGYGCCAYEIEGIGGSYEWQYQAQTFVVYGCDGTGGYGCKGKEPCGA
ncbi:unnamed protein product [Didymodactylos carnosus]|uniref:Uncharacterized protein n=1 Tax=Didymodactylos carnosus TaxID=1234261 RepID=A0A814Z7T5_9BILA|nr:unnamed protein product [Didymodactylos carnosus]CAF4000488.1 unnamed protein product [Didymodactylos carnosus]